MTCQKLASFGKYFYKVHDLYVKIGSFWPAPTWQLVWLSANSRVLLLVFSHRSSFTVLLKLASNVLCRSQYIPRTKEKVYINNEIIKFRVNFDFLTYKITQKM